MTYVWAALMTLGIIGVFLASGWLAMFHIQLFLGIVLSVVGVMVICAIFLICLMVVEGDL